MTEETQAARLYRGAVEEEPKGSGPEDESLKCCPGDDGGRVGGASGDFMPKADTSNMNSGRIILVLCFLRILPGIPVQRAVRGKRGSAYPWRVHVNTSIPLCAFTGVLSS